MSDIATRLDDALLDVDTTGREYDEAWSIQTDDTAAWASRKLRAAHHETARIDAWTERQIARIREVAAEEKRSRERDIDWFQSHLAVYLSHLIAEGRAKKSLVLPGGKIALRKRAAKLEVEDEGTFVAWLRSSGHESLVRVRESVDRAALNKAVSVEGTRVYLVESGEALEGVRADPQADSVSFTPTEVEEES
jgi:phage host-nuclease inhibitor protein Gam